jgi:uncharacterized circularly permuted ATP-grasp superfamily protein/uncharacterized alpha-E superfamily protein
VIASTESEKTPLRYSGIPGHWDEAVLSSGLPRRHWRDLYVEVGRMGMRQLNRRWHTGQQLIQSEGITYNPSSLQEGSEYTWPMDPIPLAIDQREWTHIEAAVAQRAMLLNSVLSDLYGEQRLLKERLVPSALVFANPNFLRSCFGLQPPEGIHLHTYAVDIARSPDGRWWALADRTQAPSGMGYTLQNRLITARTLPGVFNQCRVRQLARFFDMKREALLSLAATQRSNPTVVVLTPGPHNETYFEQSFLAGQWGFTLVEGADLTVLDRRVYVKTLGGLRQVDVILRRLDDDFCDPLELRGDSLLGVPGLVDAARSGSVVIDNALGSGLVETSALMAFLPQLCRELLGQELKMPSVATWWCGQEEPLRYVREHFTDLVIKPAFSRFGFRSEFPDVLDEPGRNDLLARIESRPEEFVAQERVALSTAPVFNETGFVPRHVILRVYAAWNGSSFSVLPGGLTRVSSQDSSRAVSMQLGGGSKDTWVLSAVDDHTPVRRTIVPPKGPRIAARELPSRVADNLFWLGRYTERVESRVRFARALLPTLSGEEDFGRVASLETATRLLAGLGYLPPETVFASLGEQHWQVQRTLTEMIYDPSQMSSLRWNLREMRRAAWHLKERLSLDTWRVLQQLDAQFSRVPPASVDHRYLAGMDLLDGVIVTLSAFSGLLTENTTRGFGWVFLEIGRRMERALQMAELLSSGLASAPSDFEPHLQVLLQIADSSITYRTRYPTVVQAESVLEVLMTDETNPRAVAFQLATLLQQVDRLQEIASGGQGRERELAVKALTAVRSAKVGELAQRNEEGRFAALDELIGDLRWTLYEISDVLTASYLSHLTASRLTVSW